jgi:adenylosuccinate synthase
MLNGATQIALTKLDCVYPESKGVKTFDALPTEAKQFVKETEKQTGAPVALIGNGPEALDIIDRRK